MYARHLACAGLMTREVSCCRLEAAACAGNRRLRRIAALLLPPPPRPHLLNKRHARCQLFDTQLISSNPWGSVHLFAPRHRHVNVTKFANLPPPNVPFYLLFCVKIIISCRIIQIDTHRRTRSSLSTCRSLGSFRKTSRNYQGPTPPIFLSRNYCCQRIPTMHQYISM